MNTIDQRKHSAVSRTSKASKASVKKKIISYRGKVQEIYEPDQPEPVEEPEQYNKHDLLKNYIDQQQKINDFHLTLMQNLLEDKAQ